MNKPKMIIFDYGQTLVAEEGFNGLRGTKAVLSEAANNPKNISAEEVQLFAEQLNREIGRFGAEFEKQLQLEIHNHIFQNYLYEYFDIQLTKSQEEVERIFSNASVVSEPTKNIENFLDYLGTNNIRTSVISNISYSGAILKEHINKHIPSNKFEFIIASSEYVFRKPHKRIFELALRKAKLEPEDVWYIGDNAVFDVDGAANSGIFPVWYKGALEKNNSYVPNKECLEVNDWSQLIDILSTMENK